MNISINTVKSIESILEMVRDGRLEELQSNRTIALAALALDSLEVDTAKATFAGASVTSLISDDERDALLGVFGQNAPVQRPSAGFGL